MLYSLLLENPFSFSVSEISDFLSSNSSDSILSLLVLLLPLKHSSITENMLDKENLDRYKQTLLHILFYLKKKLTFSFTVEVQYKE